MDRTSAETGAFCFSSVEFGSRDHTLRGGLWKASRLVRLRCMREHGRALADRLRFARSGLPNIVRRYVWGVTVCRPPGERKPSRPLRGCIRCSLVYADSTLPSANALLSGHGACGMRSQRLTGMQRSRMTSLEALGRMHQAPLAENQAPARSRADSRPCIFPWSSTDLRSMREFVTLR